MNGFFFQTSPTRSQTETFGLGTALIEESTPKSAEALVRANLKFERPANKTPLISTKHLQVHTKPWATILTKMNVWKSIQKQFIISPYSTTFGLNLPIIGQRHYKFLADQDLQME